MSSQALVDQDLTEAFKTFDVRQRGWLTPAKCKMVLESTFFKHANDRSNVVGLITKKMFDASPKDQDGETRVPLAEFVRIAAAAMPEPGSAEEVAAAFNALKNNAEGGEKAALSQATFVESATASDASLSEDRCKTAWSRLDTNGETQMQFQPFRSQVNGVIHSTKMEAKA